MNSRTSWQATLGRTPAGAQHGRGRFIRPNRASSANMTRKGRPLAAAMRRAFFTTWRNLFFIGFLCLLIPLRMKRTRHQLAPLMASQKIVDRTVACRMPDLLFVGNFQRAYVEQLASSRGLGKSSEKSLLFFQRHVFVPPTPLRLRPQGIDATIVVRHVRPVHCAQRYPCQLSNLGLRLPVFAQQYHLYPLPHDKILLALKCLLQS